MIDDAIRKLHLLTPSALLTRANLFKIGFLAFIDNARGSKEGEARQ